MQLASAGAPRLCSMECTQSTSKLICLPGPVVCIILNYLRNPGEVLRSLALTCKALLQTVATDCDAYWEAHCKQLGWSEARTMHQAFDMAPISSLEPRWFNYFRHRMSIRKRLRRLVDLYIPFLPRAGRMAVLPGASVAELKALEARLGVALPWEVWELLRHHAGQAPTPGVTWADDARLLGLTEVFTTPVLLASQFAHDQAVQAAEEHLQNLQLPAGVHQGHPGAATSCQGDVNQGQPLGLCFAQNPGGSRRYLVDLTSGSVMISRGLSAFVVAPSLTRFLQKLLT